MEESTSLKRHGEENKGCFKENKRVKTVEALEKEEAEVLEEPETKTLENSNLYQWAITTDCYAAWAKKILKI